MTFLDGSSLVTFSNLVQPRLAACAIEMGCVRAWSTAPRMRVEREDCPFSYSLIGGTFAPTVQSERLVKVSRAYIQRIFLFPYAGGADTESGGAESNEIASLWADRAHFYYRAHNTLATESEPSLRYCLGVQSMSDPGLVVRPAPGGERFSCLEYTLNIIMAANVKPFSPPLSEA